jgi:hypothetical protein
MQRGPNLPLPPHPRPVTTVTVGSGLEFDLVVKLSHEEIVSPVDSPAVCMLQEPHFKSPSRRVELSHLLVDFQENSLREVFCLPGIAEDSERDYVHETMVPFENNCKRIGIASLQLLDELFIAERKQFRIWNAVTTTSESSFLDTHSLMRLCNGYHENGKKYDGKIILFKWDKTHFRQVFM